MLELDGVALFCEVVRPWTLSDATIRYGAAYTCDSSHAATSDVQSIKRMHSKRGSKGTDQHSFSPIPVHISASYRIYYLY